MKKYDVLAIGELNLDLIMTGLKSQPIPGREILVEDASLVLGSSTAIAIAGMARLGLKTAIYSLVGTDEFGDKCIRFLEGYGVGVEQVQRDPNVKTGLTVSLSTSNDRALVTHLGAIAELTTDGITDELLASARHIHVGSFFLQEKLRPGLPDLFRRARALGVTTSLDSSWDDSGKWGSPLQETLAYTDFFFPNESEATAITGLTDPVEAAKALQKLGPTMIVKCGRDGALYYDGTNLLTSPAYMEMKAVDTTGAGDSFNAGFLYGYLQGYQPTECLAYGNACGAVSVTRVGGASACASLEDAKTVMEKGHL